MKSKKLILVDFNNLMYLVVFSRYLSDKYRGHTAESLSGEHYEELVRDSIKMTFMKILNILEWNQDYQPDILFAKDGYHLWRKQRLFPEYKFHRKGQRDASPVDFRLVFKVFDRVWNELKSVLPFRFINLEHIETDDIIYETIMSEMDKYDKFQIYSTDGDFKQLLRHEKVELYNPMKRKFVEITDPEFDLFEKIIRGDKSDGIPNIYTDSITQRQTPIFSTRVRNWYDDKNEFREFLKQQPKEVQKRFIRNKKLIDMRDIPNDIKEEVSKALSNNRAEFNLGEYIKVAKKYFITIMEDKADLIPQIQFDEQ